jgi:hypothetical protein
MCSNPTHSRFFCTVGTTTEVVCTLPECRAFAGFSHSSKRRMLWYTNAASDAGWRYHVQVPGDSAIADADILATLQAAVDAGPSARYSDIVWRVRVDRETNDAETADVSFEGVVRLRDSFMP